MKYILTIWLIGFGLTIGLYAPNSYEMKEKESILMFIRWPAMVGEWINSTFNDKESE